MKISKTAGALSALVVAAVIGAVVVRAGQSGAASSASGVTGAGNNWSTYLGDAGRTHYSTLSQITKANVTQLQVAWTYDTGDRGEYQANNLVVDGVLYTASPTRKVIALDAATGKEIWKFDPVSERPGAGGSRQRGLVYWAGGDDRRIFTGVGQYLYALNAGTGQVIRTFGDNGSLLLSTGIELPDGRQASVTLNTPGLIYKDMYIVGGNTGSPGAIRAYDVRTGAVRWIFYTIPRPGEFGYDTWPPNAYRDPSIGAVSNWTGSALDEQRGIVYVPTEQATPDFWGGDRKGANLFGNSLLALDANTGRRLWHFQIVHHDTNDGDLPTPPVLLTVTQNGQRIDAVAQGTKQGRLFVFNRVTGQPLWPVEERPVPVAELPGDTSWPTQPFPTKPGALMRQGYTAADVSDISAEAKAFTTPRFQVLGNHGPFPPASLKETIMFPGWDGGMEWGGAAADPQGNYYVNMNEIPWLYQMIATRRPDGTPVTTGERAYQTQCASCHGLDRTGSVANGFPSLVDISRRKTIAEATQVVQQGLGRMPSFASLEDGQRRAVIDMLFGVEQAASAYAPAPVAGRGARGGGAAGAAPPDGGAPARGGAAAGGPAAAGGGRGGGTPPPYTFGGFRRWFDEQGYPAIKPPWGTLNAVDLNTGTIKWKVPLGEYPELTAKGIPPTGTENYGGPVVTATGLIFIGATADETIRAFDKDTGRILWSAKLPFGGNATPSIYSVNGKQYVVISAGGTKSRRPSGGSLVAFALPN